MDVVANCKPGVIDDERDLAVSKHRAAAAAAAAMSDPCGDIGDGKITLVVDDTRFAVRHNIHLSLFLTSNF